MNTFQLAEDIRCAMQRTIQPSKVPTCMQIYASHKYISFQHYSSIFELPKHQIIGWGCSSTSTPNQTKHCLLGMSDTTGYTWVTSAESPQLTRDSTNPHNQ